MLPLGRAEEINYVCIQVTQYLVSLLPHPQGKLFWLNHLLSEGPRDIRWKRNLCPAISHTYICTGLAPLAQGASNQIVLRLDQQDQTEGFLNTLQSVGKTTGINSGEQQLSEVIV